MLYSLKKFGSKAAICRQMKFMKIGRDEKELFAEFLGQVDEAMYAVKKKRVAIRLLAFLKSKIKKSYPMKPPKNDDKFYWTRHVADKMRYYGISESLIKRIIRYPKRLEEGVAPDTFAGMMPAGSVKRPQEIWVMYKKM